MGANARHGPHHSAQKSSRTTPCPTVASKFASFTESQRAAVIAFLEAVIETGDDYVADQAAKALSWWRAP